MKKQLTFMAVLMSTSLATPVIGADGLSFTQWLMTFSRTKEVKPVNNQLYADECGSCHYAYPPGLLPNQSWEKLLSAQALEDHFGENAELEPEDLKTIQTYVYKNSAEKSFYKRSRKVVKSIGDSEAPIRITEIKYIKRKHHELTDAMVKGNKDVNSLSNCNACHTQADKAVFDDDTVKIPHFKTWED